MDDRLPVMADVRDAVKRLDGMAVKTPVLEVPWLNEAVGGRVFIKPECLQRTGSFKFRGAWNYISQFDPVEQAGGVVAYSSGNHAQGVAAAATLKGLPSLIVMPFDSPKIKMENTKALGAEILTYDRTKVKREELAAEQVEKRKAVLVPPFENKNIMAGQGTISIEIIEWAQQNDVDIDQVLVPTGGGGLMAGTSLVFSELSPNTKIHPVEPDDFDDYKRSLEAGEIVANTITHGSICDAIMTDRAGELTFAINKPRLSEGLTVSDDEVRAAMKFAFERLKLVVEPGGVVALAAILSGKIDCKNKNTAIVLSGGNVDPEMFAAALV